MTHVLALAPSCGSFSGYATYEQTGSVCAPSHLASVSQKLRGELELHGVTVTEAERVSAEVRRRVETLDEAHDRVNESVARGDEERPGVRSWATASERTRAIVVRGARFEDAPPLLQAELVADLRADALLVSRYSVGPMAGLGGRRTARAQLRLQRVGTGEIVWTSRCDVEVAFERSDAASLEQASRCALRRALAP